MSRLGGKKVMCYSSKGAYLKNKSSSKSSKKRSNPWLHDTDYTPNKKPTKKSYSSSSSSSSSDSSSSSSSSSSSCSDESSDLSSDVLNPMETTPSPSPAEVVLQGSGTTGIRRIKIKLSSKSQDQTSTNSTTTNNVNRPISNVKMLLSTGILEGTKVTYKKAGTQLSGIISGWGYLCGCARCRFLQVTSAIQFEQHAGSKSSNQNNHIFLDNGMSLYCVVQKLRNTPSELVEDRIRSVVSELAEVTLSPDRTIKDQSFVLRVSKKVRCVFKPKPNSTIDGSRKKRDSGLHQLVFMPNGLKDGAEVAYYAAGKRVLDGYKQGDGIVCSCCNQKVSPSVFEVHAGYSTKRQPYRHIFTSDGITLHSLAVSLKDTQSGAPSANNDGDDICGLCGDGGNLVVCDECPRAFHSHCLGLNGVPEGDWFCSHCRKKKGLGNESESSAAVGVKPVTRESTRVEAPPVTVAGGCAVCKTHDCSVSKFDERTLVQCDQCEKEYHVGCLRDRKICNLKEHPKGKWYCSEDCRKIHNALENIISTGFKPVPASVHMKLKAKGGEIGDEVQWTLLTGRTDGPDHDRTLLSKATAIFRSCFKPIPERTTGRNVIPAMVYGRTIGTIDYRGMYCAVLRVNNVVVSVGTLRILGKELAEIPLVATIIGSQGKGYCQALFSCLEEFLCGLNVENIVLPAAEEALTIWTSKFGFTKMSDNRLQLCTVNFPVMTFEGCTMLDKSLPRMTEDHSVTS